MNYTRKEILKKSLPVGLLLVTPSLITLFNKYYINGSETCSTFKKDKEEFEKTLEDWNIFVAKNDLLLDVLIINYQSIKKFDFVFLTYDHKYHDAPIVVIPKNEEYFPRTGYELKSDVSILKKFALKHAIYTLENYDHDILKRIKDCGEGNCISEDLYKPVSYMYAEVYRQRISNKYEYA